MRRFFGRAAAARSPVGYYRRDPDGTVLIELKLRSIEQLYDSFDPAPFYERMLSREAEHYILAALRELPARTPVKLVIYLPPPQCETLDLTALATVVRRNFEYRLEGRRAELRSLLRAGRASLLFGFIALIACNLASRLILASSPGAVGDLIAEGLSILGWVALWRPMDLLLFEPWPAVRDCRRLERLTKVPVEKRAMA